MHLLLGLSFLFWSGSHSSPTMYQHTYTLTHTHAHTHRASLHALSFLLGDEPKRGRQQSFFDENSVKYCSQSCFPHVLAVEFPITD